MGSWLVLASRDGLGGAGLCGVGRALAAVRGLAVPRSRIPAAVLLIRNIGDPTVAAERGGAGRRGVRRCGAGHARLAGRDGEGQRRRGGVVRVGGGRSDVGLGVAGWPDGACRNCTRRAAAAALAEPPSYRRSSLLVSSHRAAPGRQPLCE